MSYEKTRAALQEFIDALQVFILEMEARQISTVGQDQHVLAPVAQRTLDSARAVSAMLRDERARLSTP